MICLGTPVTKWYTKAFAAMGDVVAGSMDLSTWDPRYLNFLCQTVNVLIFAAIDTALAATPSTLLLDPVADGNAGSTAVRVRHTLYVPPPIVLILLSSKLSSVEACISKF